MNIQQLISSSLFFFLACCALAHASTFAQTITHVPLFTFAGDQSAGQGFGLSVSGAGDVNGDGVDDLIVGAVGQFNGDDSGYAQVFSGSDGSMLYHFDSDSAIDEFGHSVSGVGDVNGDGFNDLIVGAPNDDNNGDGSGSARVFSGSDGSVLYNFQGNSAGERLGWSVSGAGDVNNDGIDDLIVGALPEAGSDSGHSATVFSGVDGSVLYSFIGNFPGNSIGFSVSSAGDVNADGFADLIVAGARVFSGIDGSLLYNFEEDVLGISSSVSGAGDVNGDGFDDLIVGAWSANNYRGSAQVFSGFDGNELYSFEGDSEEDWLGLSVSGAGDVNGDGFADLIVGAAGAWGDDIGSFNIGYARVFSGSDGSGFSGTDEKVLYTFDGDREYDFFGRSVSGVGDVNGDGVADFVVGADTGGADYAGYVRVFVSQITPSVLKGDVDRNGDVDFDDIPAFISVLQAGVFQAEVDCDCSDVVDFADIPAFIAILQSQ